MVTSCPPEPRFYLEDALNTVDHPPLTTEEKVHARKALIPLWIKLFGWLFIVMGAGVPFLYVGSLLFGFTASYGMFGLEYTGNAMAWMPLLIAILIFINGLCAYGLLFGKDWGLTACISFGFIGLALTLGTMLFDAYVHARWMIRLEPILQIPYLIKIQRLKSLW